MSLFLRRLFPLVSVTLAFTSPLDAGATKDDAAANALFEGSPADQVDAAYARLAVTPHRKRETVHGLAASQVKIPPMVTEVVGDRTRLVYEIDVPRHGKVRSECISVGQRRAVRTIAPELLAMILKAKTKATLASARSLLRQIMSVAMAMQTGGLSSAQILQEVVQAGATMKSAADAQRVLGQAADAFNTWQLVPVDPLDEEFGPMERTSAGMQVTFVGEETGRQGKVRKYLRQAPSFPGVPAMIETLLIDAATGLPVGEEMSMGGQRMMQVDYFDHGAAITIELPECLALTLRASG